MADALTDELRRILLSRLDGYERLITDILGGLDESRAGLRSALGLVATYPDAVRDAFHKTWESQPTVRRLQTERFLKHVNRVVEKVDDFVLRAVEAEVPPALTAAAERACDELLSGTRIAVVTVGRPDHFGTVIGSLEDILFSNLTAEGADVQRTPSMALLQVPRLTGASSTWRPVLLGHEVAHLATRERPTLERFTTPEAFEEEADTVALPEGVDGDVKVSTLSEWRTAWIEELICDAYSIHRFGPAALAAFGSFLHAASAHGHTQTHPPSWLRLQAMVSWLEDTDVPAVMEPLITPWRDLEGRIDELPDEWARLLTQDVSGQTTEIMAAVKDWDVKGWDPAAAAANVARVAARVEHGLPTTRSEQAEVLDDAYILNGGWVAIHRGTRYPVSDLVNYSLNVTEFLSQWEAATDPADVRTEPELHPDPPLTDIAGAALSSTGIRRRLEQGPDRGLVITPLMDLSIGAASVDLRLGNKFVLFRSNRIEAFNPLEKVPEARAIQAYTQKRWGQPFVLHPNELVLAHVLEYLKMPGDLSAQVLTRSSYGRLGLVTATATFIEPNYKGSLTLELVNLSEVPMSLTPGQRIAQLVLQQLDGDIVEDPASARKYHCPTGPEFSKVHTDRDNERLRRMRNRWRDRPGIQPS